MRACVGPFTVWKGLIEAIVKHHSLFYNMARCLILTLTFQFDDCALIYVEGILIFLQLPSHMWRVMRLIPCSFKTSWHTFSTCCSFLSHLNQWPGMYFVFRYCKWFIHSLHSINAWGHHKSHCKLWYHILHDCINDSQVVPLQKTHELSRLRIYI